MSIDETADIEQARRWFAEELRHTAHVRSPAVVDAFATVPREHFAGPGPWRVLSPLGGPDYWTTDDADPRRLCHDLLVAIDETRRLNNGQPSLWAALFDQLGLATGDRVDPCRGRLGLLQRHSRRDRWTERRGDRDRDRSPVLRSGRARTSRAPGRKRRSSPPTASPFELMSPSTRSSSTPASTHLALPWLEFVEGGRRSATRSSHQRQPLGRIPHRRAPRRPLSGSLVRPG